VSEQDLPAPEAEEEAALPVDDVPSDDVPAEAAPEKEPEASPEPGPAEPPGVEIHRSPEQVRRLEFARTLAVVLFVASGALWAGLLIGEQKGLSRAKRGDPGAATASERPRVWTCSMHPQIKLPEPGACPLCGMDLIPLDVDAGGGEPRVLELSEAAAALAEVETSPVQRRPVSREVRMVGVIDYDETRFHYITAWISGRLDRLFVDYTGTRVRKDDHLVEIYSPELLSAQQELLQALESRRRLRESDSKLLRNTADSTVASAREKLRLWGLGADQIAAIEERGAISEHVTLRAPFGGVVVHKNKNQGEYVRTGERIYAIADLSHLWVKLDAHESDLSWVRYGQTVRFETEAYPGVPFEARVVFIDPVLTARTRTVKVRLNIENKSGRLKPGMFVRAVLNAPVHSQGLSMDPTLAGKWICPMHNEVIHDEQGTCEVCQMALVRAETLYPASTAITEVPLVVPAEAVLWTGVRSLVYVRRPGKAHAFEGREITLGTRAGSFYVVLDGLSEGDLVVTRGAFKIDSALQIEARPSMMLPAETPPEPVRQEVLPAFVEELGGVFGAYLRAQSALAGDDLRRARQAFAELPPALSSVKVALSGSAQVAWIGLLKRLRDATAAAADAGDIAAIRAAFAPLSATVLELELVFGHPDGDLREVFCSMAQEGKGASWLQEGKAVRNPFYGASMLACGEVKQVHGPRSAASSPCSAM
jgi:Cu(I)/Ag(I) efflux system membrane fusion protein